MLFLLARDDAHSMFRSRLPMLGKTRLFAMMRVSPSLVRVPPLLSQKDRRPPTRERVIFSVRDPPGANDNIPTLLKTLPWSKP